MHCVCVFIQLKIFKALNGLASQYVFDSLNDFSLHKTLGLLADRLLCCRSGWFGMFSFRLTEENKLLNDTTRATLNQSRRFPHSKANRLTVLLSQACN